MKGSNVDGGSGSRDTRSPPKVAHTKERIDCAPKKHCSAARFVQRSAKANNLPAAEP